MPNNPGPTRPLPPRASHWLQAYCWLLAAIEVPGVVANCLGQPLQLWYRGADSLEVLCLNSGFLCCLIAIRVAVAWGGVPAARRHPLGAAAVAIHATEVPIFATLLHRNMVATPALWAAFPWPEQLLAVVVMAFVAANPFVFYYAFFPAPVRV